MQSSLLSRASLSFINSHVIVNEAIDVEREKPRSAATSQINFKSPGIPFEEKRLEMHLYSIHPVVKLCVQSSGLTSFLPRPDLRIRVLVRSPTPKPFVPGLFIGLKLLGNKFNVLDCPWQKRR